MGRTKGYRILRKAAEDFVGFVPPKTTDKIKAPPAQLALYNKTTQPPVPLTYKLQTLPTPYNANTPLGNTESLPFQVQRTHTGNLPVYTEFKNNRNQKLTIIRKITGDVDKFRNELTKVVSNYETKEKLGRVEVKGLHTEVIKQWLLRLGF
jgi:Mitochondrial large subunit ribosomal protein (Img2)